MPQLDLVLINPGGHADIYSADAGWSFEKAGATAKEPPIWAGMIATYTRRRGFSVEILDANLLNLTGAQTAERIHEMNPQLAAFVIYGHQPSASTQTMVPAREAAKRLKELAPEIKILFVGGHVAALPERTLREEAADFTCGGEGPVTVADLLSALKAGSTDLHKVRDLWWLEEGHVRENAHAPLITNLDQEIPRTAWDLIDAGHYRAHDWHCYGRLERREPYVSIYTTLGCPYRCGFCCIQAPFKSGELMIGQTANTYRRWSLETVTGWIQYLVEERGVENIKIADEMFVLNPRHVLGICDFIIKRGWGERLNIWAYSRIDTCRPEFIDKLRRAGFRWLAFGIEAADASVRTDVDKGRFQEDAIYKILRSVQGAGINIIANYIFGLPKDTLETMQATLDLALGVNSEAANFYCTMAYPGSSLNQEARQKGWALPDDPGGPGWIGYSQHSYETLPLPTETVSAGEVLRFRDEAYRTYHSDPGVIAAAAYRFGEETAAHIAKLGQRKFARKYY